MAPRQSYQLHTSPTSNSLHCVECHCTIVDFSSLALSPIIAGKIRFCCHTVPEWSIMLAARLGIAVTLFLLQLPIFSLGRPFCVELNSQGCGPLSKAYDAPIIFIYLGPNLPMVAMPLH